MFLQFVCLFVSYARYQLGRSQLSQEQTKKTDLALVTALHTSAFVHIGAFLHPEGGH